jgi:hypothetical protein
VNDTGQPKFNPVEHQGWRWYRGNDPLFEVTRNAPHRETKRVLVFLCPAYVWPITNKSYIIEAYIDELICTHSIEGGWCPKCGKVYDYEKNEFK